MKAIPNEIIQGTREIARVMEEISRYRDTKNVYYDEYQDLNKATDLENYDLKESYRLYIKSMQCSSKDIRTKAERKCRELSDKILSKWGHCFHNTPEIPYSERQFIFLVANERKIAGCYDETDTIDWVFPVNKIPSDLIFPTGHPLANTLYVCHPIRQELYLPYEEAEMKLFHEKVHEFCYLMQCLGAMEITYHSVKGEAVSGSSSERMSVGGGVNVKFVGASGNYNSEYGRSQSMTSNQGFDVRQTFNPTKRPFCPNDLVWFNTDEEWKMLVKQRLQGGLLTYQQRISSKETCHITNSQREAVKAAFRAFIFKVNGSYDNASDSTFDRSEETIWDLSVKFKEY